MANSTARRLSSAEISEAAQRVERLLYELKEQGVEFPGRMRDHVAEACNVSRTKLANLKLIESNCIADFRKMWAGGKIPDATALELSRCDTAFQMRMRDAFAKLKSFPTAASIESLRDMQKKGVKWRPSACLHCPDGRLCPSSRDDAVLRHDATCCSFEPKCKGEMCCMDCKYGAKARGCYDVCAQICSRAKQYRTDKNADAKAAEAEAQEAKQRWRRGKIQHDAQRLVRAADAAGCPNSAVLDFRNGSCPTNLAMIRRYAEGNFGDERFWHDDRLVPDGAKVPAICETLRCSADYLLGLTDDLKPTPSGPDPLRWRTGRDFPDGPVLLLISENGSILYETDDVHGGSLCWFEEPDDGEILRWLPLPELPKEDDDAET